MANSSSRLRRRYRFMCNDDGGTASHCFFCTDGADMTAWVELANDTPVRIYAGLEEAYRAGHTATSTSAPSTTALSPSGCCSTTR